MAPRSTPARRKARASEPLPPRRISLGEHTFRCYDQPRGKQTVVVMDEQIVQLSTTTYQLFTALLERATHPVPDGILPIDEMLRVALLGEEDDPYARRALRKRLHMLRTKIEAFGLELSCVQERHAAVGYLLRFAA